MSVNMDRIKNGVMSYLKQAQNYTIIDDETDIPGLLCVAYPDDNDISDVKFVFWDVIEEEDFGDAKYYTRSECEKAMAAWLIENTDEIEPSISLSFDMLVVKVLKDDRGMIKHIANYKGVDVQ